MKFHDALTKKYCENPCQVLPNALWKTLARLESLQVFAGFDGEDIVRLEAWDENGVIVYWSRDREHLPDFGKQQGGLKFVLLHQDYLRRNPFAEFKIRRPYFRLVHREGESKAEALPPHGFRIVEVNPGKEAKEVSQLIGQCYANTDVTAETVRNWTKHPTHDPSLWIWIMDDARKIPVGLGIAECDPGIREGSLEWIQVLPGYRGKKLGKTIVQELLSRIKGRAEFTTVAGERDNETNPEALYRSCGFTGTMCGGCCPCSQANQACAIHRWQ